jgi:hypothetical protein
MPPTVVSEISVLISQSKRCHISQDSHLHDHGHENLYLRIFTYWHIYGFQLVNICKQKDKETKEKENNFVIRLKNMSCHLVVNEVWILITQ